MAAPTASAAQPLLGPDEFAIAPYAAKYGVSEATARANLTDQARGADLFDASRKRLGAGFAGAWYDNEKGRWTIGVTDAGSVVRAEELLRSRSLDDSVVEKLDFSFAELDQTRARLVGESSGLLAQRSVAIGIDPSRNAVVAEVSSAAKQAEKAFMREEAREADAKVVVVERPASRLVPEPGACSFPYCTPSLRGGVGINGPSSSCTLGYVAYVPSNGARAAFTAGHCITGAGNWNTSRLDGTFPLIGPAALSTRGAQGDFGLISVTGSVWNQPLHSIIALWDDAIGAPADSQYYLLDRAQDTVGQFLCRTGRIVPLSCGTVNMILMTQPSSDGITYGNLTRSDACMSNGDSGGPWIGGNHYAYGMSSLFFACGAGQQLWTMPIAIAEATYGVRIITSVTGSPK